MGLRINTNIASMNAQRHMGNVTMRLQGNYSRLASGLRIASAADDAAGLAISERMRSQIRSYGVAARNTQDGISLAQTAESALNEVSNLLIRARELSVQSANGTLAQADRNTIQVEVDAIIDELTRISTEAVFNGVALLDGTGTVNIQVGIEAGQTVSINAVDTTVSTLGVDTLNITSQGAASAALGTLDTAIGSVNTARGQLGAAQNRMQSALSTTLNVRENLSAAESRIRDVDIASETADLTRNSIMQQAAVSILQQANVQPQIALSLIQG
ncbi:MAG: flagellin [Chlamydiales bacterium]|jgi:flagellin